MLKRFLPKSLYARVALIVILPIFLMQSVITYVFFDRHWDTVTANQSANVAGQISLLTRLYEAAPDDEARRNVEKIAFENLDISTRFEAGKTVPGANKLSPFNLYNKTLDRQLREELDRPFWFDTKSWPFYVEIRVQTDGGYLVFLPFRDRVFATTGPVFVLWLIGTSLLLGSIAIVFLRNQVRSILRLAAAAEAFGRGRDMPGFRPSGATEVRRAGRAFIAMRERLKRHLDQRTTMLAGVSHDLRTPLTRMKLALAMLPDNADAEELRRDVAEMEKMIESYLEFASDISSAGEPETFDLCALVQEAIFDADPSSVRIAADLPSSISFEGRPAALKRAVGNLIGNGLKYANRIAVSIRRKPPYVEIIVDDDGVGIPENRRRDVFKPFFRLDEARSGKEGVGLGLAIVREVARSHGGDVTLADSPLGGLRAVLKLPA
ncbi:MAG TPA: ATP-binding protein [Parvularculaceae bacterium]|nr:ATP-binding protein [Parvularculaceae bacterium]